MKIGPAIFTWAMPMQVQQEKAPQTPMQQMENAKQELKETAQRIVAEIQEAQNDMGDDDPKVQSLMEKFKSGRKLTSEEMNYIRKNAPGAVEYIDRIMREREIMELSMRMAPSKTDVQITAFQIAKTIKNNPNAEDKEVLTKHLADAKHEYEQTDEYKDKPNSLLDREERPVGVKYKRKPNAQQTMQAYDYLQIGKREKIEYER